MRQAGPKNVTKLLTKSRSTCVSHPYWSRQSQEDLYCCICPCWIEPLVTFCHDETERKDKAIHYTSNKFTPYEACYSLLECTYCALTWISQELRHYFCVYTTYLISRMDPLKYIFQKPMPTGILAK